MPMSPRVFRGRMRNNRAARPVNDPAVRLHRPVDKPLVQPVNGFNDTLGVVIGVLGKNDTLGSDSNLLASRKRANSLASIARSSFLS